MPTRPAVPRERGILFSAEMIHALLARRKTQTRRVVTGGGSPAAAPHPFGAVGDRLWVREAWRTTRALDADSGSRIADTRRAEGEDPPRVPIRYEADGARRDWPDDGSQAGRYRNARFMPRWASRLTLTVVDVRMEPLQDCRAEDAIAEGIACVDDPPGAIRWRDYGRDGGATADPVASYRALWDTLHGVGSWASNPLVWVVTFRVDPPAAARP